MGSIPQLFNIQLKIFNHWKMVNFLDTVFAIKYTKKITKGTNV